ncbi:MAG: AMP-binding protein [Desulfomonile tiedjei]|uniref:AMP-binding protein n=1 Tax=Desulfomonile tiedjei TaxID=2358 RepID=A0A9D6Z5N3_9BACT|nr:AMP-binding protein [Desulfomonile tiedjei]
MMNLSRECIEKNASRIPNRPAVIDGTSGVTYTYAELNAKVNCMANALHSLGIRKGDRVALYLRNVPEFIVAFLACSKIGAISVPFNIMLKKMEIEYILNHSGAKILFGMAGETNENVLPIWENLPSLEKIVSVQGIAGGGSNPNVLTFGDLISQNRSEFTAVDLDESDGLCLLYTSGTTVKPKGALSTHASWLSQAALNASHVVPMTEEDRVLTGAPYFHVYVVFTVLPTLYAGAAVVTLQRFFPKETLELITKYRGTHFMGTPTMWAYLIEEYLKNKELYDLSSFWFGQCAGSLLPSELAKQIEKTFGIGLVECYGSTETSSTVTHTRFNHFLSGTPGWPAPGWQIKIVDDGGTELPHGEIGELWCKGPGVIKEYWNDPEMTGAKINDGWWKSGDLGYVKGGNHADSLLYIVDRKDDMLVCGGYNIYPSEVESYLTKHPKVLQAVVIGIPDKVKGEIPKAFLVLAPGQTATEEEVMQWAKNNMAAYKAPRKVEFTTIDELPKTATGKILKRELKRIEIEKSK